MTYWSSLTNESHSWRFSYYPSVVQPRDQLRIRRTVLPGFGSFIKGNHLLRDKGQTVFDRKVARVQPMHLRMGEILEIRLTAFACEEDVVLSPENNRLGLLLSEERLPMRVELYVCPVVVEEVELDPPSMR